MTERALSSVHPRMKAGKEVLVAREGQGQDRTQKEQKDKPGFGGMEIPDREQYITDCSVALS